MIRNVRTDVYQVFVVVRWCWNHFSRAVVKSELMFMYKFPE